MLLFRLPVENLYGFLSLTSTLVANIKNVFCGFSVSCVLPGFMVASHDAFPFCGKQKFVRCGVCDIGIHWVCLQLSEADQATITETVKSAFKRDACARTFGPTSNDRAPAKSPGSLSYEGATSRAPPNKEVFSPTVSSVSTELEAVTLNTIRLIESLVDMVSKLTEDVTNLKNDNISMKQEINNLYSLIFRQSLDTFLRIFLWKNASCRRQGPTRTRAFICASHHGLSCCFYTCR